MRRKTFVATLCVLMCAVAFQVYVGGDDQTSPFVAKQEIVSTVTVKPVEVSGLDLSPAVTEPGFFVNVIRNELAVDENGDLYMIFSLQTPSPSGGLPEEEPHLVKYDKSGRLMAAFPLPDFLFAQPRRGGVPQLGRPLSGQRLCVSALEGEDICAQEINPHLHEGGPL